MAMQTTIAKARALILDMLHSEGMGEIVDALPEGAVLPILHPILEALSPSQRAHYLREASAALAISARSSSPSPSTTAINPRSPSVVSTSATSLKSFRTEIDDPQSPPTSPTQRLRRLRRNGARIFSIGALPTVVSLMNEELWPGDSFRWVPPLTPLMSTLLLPLHTLPVLVQSRPLLPNAASSAEPEAIFVLTVVPTSAPTATSWPQATLRGGAHRVSVLVVGPLGISLGTARNSRQPTTPGTTTMSLRMRETHQDRIAELAEQVLNRYEGGNVTVFTIFPYSFSVPVGFQSVFSLIHYAYPFLHSHATYVDDTFYSRK
jgi:hypothetical protein